MRTKIISRGKGMLHLWKKVSHKSLLKIGIIQNLEIIAIVQVNVEAQHIVFVI